jgi:hypothetical protein
MLTVIAACLLCSESEGHQYVPRMLDALAAVFITQISACGFHSGALSSGGEVSAAATVIHNNNINNSCHCYCISVHAPETLYDT